MTTDHEQGRVGLEHALDVADVAVVVLTVDGGIVRSWSPAAERIFGYSASDVLGTVDPVVLAEHDDAETAALRRAIAAGDVLAAVEQRRTRKDGRPVDILLTVAPLGTVAGELRLVALVADITARVRLESRLVRAERLEAIGRFAGGIAHDFNNILTAVGGFAYLVGESLDPNDERRADIEEIRRAADRGKELTHQLLAFSRRQVLRPTVVDVNAVIEGLAPMLERLLGEQVELVLGLDRGAGSSLVDRGQLEQVVVNLALNARDAMPKGGRLLIETASVVLDADYASSQPDARVGVHVMIAVSDEGTGMDAETMASLFEPFFTTKAGQGTGLGLATVYGIVRQSGGHVSVYSEPGFGTTFRVYLPATRSRELLEPGTGPPDEVELARGAVLVVEDDPAVRDFAVRALLGAGFSVQSAPTPTEARRMAERDRPDLLITDLVLPGESGLSLAQSLRAAQPELGVLFVSGYPEMASLDRGLLESTGSFLPKPFSAQDLVHMAAKTLAAADLDGLDAAIGPTPTQPAPRS